MVFHIMSGDPRGAEERVDRLPSPFLPRIILIEFSPDRLTFNYDPFNYWSGL